MSFIDNLSSGSTSSSSYFERAAGRIGDTVKDIVGEQISANSTSAIQTAISKVAGGALGDFFEGFVSADQTVPMQYTGNTDQVSPNEDYYATDKYAISKYNMGASSNEINDSHPMLKYMFLAEFTFTKNSYSQTNLMSLFPKALTLSLKNTTFPRVDIETEEINQYNKTRIASKKVHYQPVTATFGENMAHLVNGKTNVSMIEIWEAIASYYVNDFRIPDSTSIEQTRAFGHRSGNIERNILKYIDLYIIWPSSTKRIRLVNPYITSFNYDALDYTADDQVLATFDIKYEYYELTQIRGDFYSFVNSTTAAEAIQLGQPYDFVNAQDPRNFDVATVKADIDDTRANGLDNTYAQTAIQLAETEAIQSLSSLLGSDDPLDQALGEAALREAMDAGKTIANVSGVFEDAEDAIQGLGKSANSFLKGLF